MMEGDRHILPRKGSHTWLISGTRVHRQQDVMGHTWAGLKGYACATWGAGRRHT